MYANVSHIFSSLIFVVVVVVVVCILRRTDKHFKYNISYEITFWFYSINAAAATHSLGRLIRHLKNHLNANQSEYNWQNRRLMGFSFEAELAGLISSMQNAKRPKEIYFT